MQAAAPQLLALPKAMSASMFNQIVSQPLNLRSVLLQNLKSAQTRRISMFEAFGVGQSIQKACVRSKPWGRTMIVRPFDRPRKRGKCGSVTPVTRARYPWFELGSLLLAKRDYVVPV
jgi:hypothetical protein